MSSTRLISQYQVVNLANIHIYLLRKLQKYAKLFRLNTFQYMKHFYANIFPSYCIKACAGLKKFDSYSKCSGSLCPLTLIS